MGKVLPSIFFDGIIEIKTMLVVSPMIPPVLRLSLASYSNVHFAERIAGGETGVLINAVITSPHLLPPFSK